MGTKKEKPVKAPKEPKQPKPKKEKASKTGMLDRFRKKQNASAEEDGLDILTDVKEPFSVQNFFEIHVVERARRIKNTLQERGILFFLFSPFQARNRLIAQLFILFIGVMFGVVPRASSLVNALQNQAYVSEIAGLSSKTVGSITITPAAASNYQKLHMLAFVVEGKNLPSDASKYEVHLARSYGASDWSDVTYSWMIYPVTDTRRILLVAVDQSKQASGYGAFNLYIQLSGEEVADYAKTPFEITLSTAQETTDLYNKTGVHLSALTKAICGSGEIAEKQAEFEEALAKYQVAVEQAEAMPVDIHVAPTRDDLETFCLANRIYRTLDDDSTTEDITDMEQVDDLPQIDYDVVITSEGIEYDREFVDGLKESGDYSDADAIVFDAFESVDEAKKDVVGAMESVNSAAMSWYSTLTSYKLILNQTIESDTFPLYARCNNTIDEAISFIDKEASKPDEKEPGGLSGTMTGDDPDVKPTPSDVDEKPEEVTEEVTEEPSEEVTEEPTEEESEEEQKPEDEEISETPATSDDTKTETDSAVSEGTATAPVSGDPADSK